MNNRITFSILVAVLFAFLCILKAQAQEDDCNKTKVAVSVEIVDAYNLLENDFGPRAKSEWNNFTTKMLVQILSEYEPEITFFPLSKGGEDCHYFFEAGMTLITVGEEDNKQTGYLVTASLIANANCIPSRSGELQSSMTYGKDRMLNQAMKNLVSTFWPMDRNIVLYEKDHPSPPRKPELNIQIGKEFISPLDKESRKTKVNAKVFDCRGNQVCDTRSTTSGQPVYYQDKIDRLDLKIGNCSGGYPFGNFMVIITNKDCDNEGEYKLEKGIDAEKKTIRFRTCQLGGPIVEEEKELIIRGIKIEVKPDRREIEPDERTKIVITLNETDPDGSRYPVEGKEIDVKINGLENGTIKPENGYTTTSDGKVVLDYKAGSNDEKITVAASFQPEDYPDKAEGKGSVTVKPPEYDAKLNISGKYEKIIKTSKKDTKDGSVDNHSLNESLEVSVSIFLEFIQAEDMPIFYQTFQYYKPTSVSITGFTYNSEENRYMSGPAFETNINFNRTASKQKIDGKEYLSQVPWVLVIDNETKKAVKLIHAGYGISYEVLESEIMNSVNYSTNVPQRKSETTTKTSSKSFSLGPVGEKVQDPTIKRSDTWVQDYLKKKGVEIPAGVPIPKIPNQADQQEIYPDILVKYGDGKTSFGGEGRLPIKEEIEDGYQEENLHYSWNMTVKKKK
jgi:hypothetical protein